MTDEGIRRRAEKRGIATGYREMSGRFVEVGIDTLRHVLEALGDDEADDDRAGFAPVYVTRTNRPWRYEPPRDAPCHLRLETGEERTLPDELPGDLPLGHHTLVHPRRETPFLVVPDRVYLPPRLRHGGRLFGLAVQLYALRSDASWGIGDLADLAALPEAAGDPGFVLLNPLHAPRPTLPQEASPYFASTRRFRNPLYIAAEAVPEVALLGADERARFEHLAADGRALTAERLIDRDRALRAKDAALSLCYAALERSPSRCVALARFRAATAELELYATFCALAERHPGDWRWWPARFREPGRPEVEAFAHEHADRVSYHAYLQLLLDEQLAAVRCRPLGLVADLAVGAARDGYDGWRLQDELAQGVTVGAPPDDLGPKGQDWGLPPFLPHRLAANGYRSFAETLRANMVHAGGLRIDHVAGLFRLFWIPEGLPPSAGTYVSYPADDLLGVLALESRRARCLVVGEDLGTLAPGARETLAAHDILSYRLAWFEDRPPRDYPRLAMAAVTTHDLPTVAGFFSGADLAHLHAIGVMDDVEYAAVEKRQVGERLALLEHLSGEGLLAETRPSDPRAVVAALYAFLAQAPSMLVAVSLDDALGATMRPNVPGTVAENPNWRMPLPKLLEEFAADADLRRVIDAVRSVSR